MAVAKSTKTSKPGKQPVKAATAKDEAVFDEARTGMAGMAGASGAQAPELFRTIAETNDPSVGQVNSLRLVALSTTLEPYASTPSLDANVGLRFTSTTV